MPHSLSSHMMNKLLNVNTHGCKCLFLSNISKFPKRSYHGTIATTHTANQGNLVERNKHVEEPQEQQQQRLIRLSKRMSELNLCSRREADRLISQSRVLVNGMQVDILGTKVSPLENNIRILDENENDYDSTDAQNNMTGNNHDSIFNWDKIRGDTVVLHKPKDYVSGQPDPKHGHQPAVRLLTRENIYFPPGDNYDELKYTLTSGNYLNFARRWTQRRYRDENGNFPDERKQPPSTLLNYAPAGRLDLDTTGVLIFTKNGVIAKQILGQSTEKEYVAEVEPVDSITRHERNMGIRFLPYPPQWDLGDLSKGGKRLWNDRKPMRPLAGAEWIEEGRGESGEWNGTGKIKFILREGKKRQIRRMCREVLGLNVKELRRVRVGNVKIDDLPEGCWRTLTEDEVRGFLS